MTILKILSITSDYYYGFLRIISCENYGEVELYTVWLQIPYFVDRLDRLPKSSEAFTIH